MSLDVLTRWEFFCQMSSAFGKTPSSHEGTCGHLLLHNPPSEMDFDSFLPPCGFYGGAKSEYSRVIAAAVVSERTSGGQKDRQEEKSETKHIPDEFLISPLGFPSPPSA